MNSSNRVRARSARSRASRSKLATQIRRGGNEAVGTGGDDVGLAGPHVQSFDVAAEAPPDQKRALQRGIQYRADLQVHQDGSHADLHLAPAGPGPGATLTPSEAKRLVRWVG